jgi:tetratricopeptide (TPR) repeat protein
MNQMHCSILTDSVRHWNDWRISDHTVRPDLSGADLSGSSLFEANLDDAQGQGAVMRGAVLIRVTARLSDFSGADFNGAQLQGADFSRCNLAGASFQKANLTGAILKGANLMDADFTGADCSGARFENANLQNAVFYDAKVKGANFEQTNIQEARLFAEHFSDAIISLESVGGLEKKRKVGLQYANLFLIVSFFLILLFFFHQLIFRAEKRGTLPTKIRAVIYLQAGSILDAAGSREKGEAYLQKSISYNPKDPRPYYVLGSVYRREKDPERAIPLLKKFVELSPPSDKTQGLTIYINENEARIKSRGR